jgi:uncharacterized lipoprotein YajG
MKKLIIISAIVFLAGCGYNTDKIDDTTMSIWKQTAVVCYQIGRADAVPGLVL